MMSTVDRLVVERGRMTSGLGDPYRRQRGIEVPLPAALRVPFRLAVAGEVHQLPPVGA